MRKATPGNMLRRLGAVVEFEVRAFFVYRGVVLVQLFVEPLAYLALLAAGLQGLNQAVELSPGRSVAYLSYAFPGVLALQVIRTLGKMLARATVERRWGLMGMKFVLGTHPVAYVLGMLVVPVLAFVTQALVSAPLGVMLGARFTLGGLVGAVFWGAVAVTFWCGLALIVTAAVRSYEQRDLIITLTLLPLTFAAPTFYPLETAPPYLQILASVNPVTYQVTAMRSALLGNAFLPTALWTLGLSLLVVFLSVIVVSKSERLPSEH